MKTQHQLLLQPINSVVKNNLMQVVTETVATNTVLISHKKFSVANLWRIQKNRKITTARKTFSY